MPTLRQLDYLVAISETKHFNRAARRVHATQSTLSLQLKALEERLGVTLVKRTSRCVVLTETGDEIAAIARRMLRDAERIREIARANSTVSKRHAVRQHQTSNDIEVVCRCARMPTRER